MTRGFWGDPERYLETYWRRFPGIWTHGDWASVDEDGAWFLHGRSDDTLNIAGKRVGPAEIESAAVAHPAVAEAAAVGVPHGVKGEVAWVFCVLAAGRSATEEEIRTMVAAVARQGLCAGTSPVRSRLAEDAVGEDRAPGGPCDRARRRSRRHVLGRKPRRAGGDLTCSPLSWPERRRSSRAAGAGSERTSRASSPRRACASPSAPGRASRSSESRRRSAASRSTSTSPSRTPSTRRSPRTESELGPIDLLVNNAGIQVDDTPLWESDQADWWSVFEVNVRGPYLLCRAAARGMAERGEGRIVNVTSGMAWLEVETRPGASVVYASSKAALHRFSEVLAEQLRPHGIFVFSIDPGLVRTSMTAGFPDDAPWAPPECAPRLVRALGGGRAGRTRGSIPARGAGLARRAEGAPAFDPARRPELDPSPPLGFGLIG